MLIINADDFGLSHQVNRAIVQAFAEGLCSSCTIMPNMPAFDEACDLVHELGLQNHVGIHLVLTEGEPLTEKIRHLRRFCDEEGLFCLSRKRRVFHLNGDEREALAAEMAAQIRRCRTHHLGLTHLDSHNHAHEEWGIGSLLIPLARDERIPYVRLSRNFGPALTPAKRLYKYLFNQRLRREGLARTTYFGSPEDYRLFLKDPRNRQGPPPSWAVMVHPAFDEYNRLVDSWIEKPLGSAIATLDGYEDAVSYAGHRYQGRVPCETEAASGIDKVPSHSR